MAWQDWIDEVQKLYVAYYQRPADPAGLRYWAQIIEDYGIQTAVNGFVNSPEAQSLYGGDIDAVITAVYLSAFGREPEPETGLDYWRNVYLNGWATLGTIVWEIVNGAKGIDAIVLQNKLTSAMNFTQVLDPELDGIGPFKATYSGDEDAQAGRDFLSDVTATTVKTEIDAISFIQSKIADPGDPILSEPTPTTGKTFVLTEGIDNVVGTMGDDTIVGDTVTPTFHMADQIDGGAGNDTLVVYNEDMNGLSLSSASIKNVENFVLENYYDDSDDLNINIGNINFKTVTLDYNGTPHKADVYIYNIPGQTTLIIENVAGYGAKSFYRNYDEKYDPTPGEVSVTNIIRNFDAVTYNNYSYFEGYEYFSKATTINHTLTLENIDGGDQGFSAYESIEAQADNAVINTTVNIINAITPGSYVEAYIWIQNESTVDLADTVNATINIQNSDGVYVEVDSYYSGESGKSDVITYNIDGLKNSSNKTELWSAGFETININVGPEGAELEGIDDYYAIAGDQTINIKADGNFKTGSTRFDGTVGNVTLTVSGSGKVDLGEAYLGDGDTGDVVIVDAKNLSGDFWIYEVYGNAKSIETGSGNDFVKLGGINTSVKTGEGNDVVDINGKDFSDSKLPSNSIDGGPGVNTIVINDGRLLNSKLASIITNFQVLDISGATGSDTYDMSLEPSLNKVIATGHLGPITIDKASAGTSVELKAKASEDTNVSSLTYSLKDATGENDLFTLSLTAWDTDKDGNVDGKLTIGSLTANGIEVFDISSKVITTDKVAPADYDNTISALSGDSVSIINLYGEASLTISSVDAPNLTKVDASSMTGKLDITLDGAYDKGLALIGGSGDDTFEFEMSGTFASNNIIQGNAGADSIILPSPGTKETIRIATDTDSVFKGVDTDGDGKWDDISGFDIIENFKTGEDKIELSAGLGLATGDARAAIAYKGTITGGIADGLQALIGSGSNFFSDGVVTRALAAVGVDWDGDGNVDDIELFIDTNADGNFTNGVDQVIVLVGVSSLDISDIIFG